MTSTLRGLLLALSGALSLQVASCGSDEKAACSGTERCACYPNGTCDGALTCLSNTCVDPNATGGASSGTGGKSNGSGGTSSTRGGASTVEAGMTGAGTGSGDAGGDGLGGDTSTGMGGASAGGTTARGGASQGGTGTAQGGKGTAQGGTTTDAGAVGTDAGAAGAAGAGDRCRSFETYPEGTVPTVFVLVDRSGSMFHCLSSQSIGNCPDLTDSPWTALKSGVLDMVEQLEGTVRFGFGTFAGEMAGTCPSFDKVAAKLNNYDAIAELYESVTPPVKGETPTAQVLKSVLTILQADPSPGEKYVLLVTDGEPDFCDDGDPLCPVDATVAQLQAMHTAGVGTLVFGVDSTVSTISAATLQAFANAGAGEPVAPLSITTPTPTSYQCSGRPSWNSLFAASGKTAPESLGAYSTNGTATVFRPDPTDQQALTTLFRGAVSGVKSCQFDLASGLSVDLAQQSRATVAISGQMIARNASNGWSMTSATQLKLAGSACALWRDPASRTIDFNFPCGVVVSE